MRLFGLKNEKGEEVELTMSSQMDEYGNLVRYFIGNISVINKEPPPQLKAGCWCYYTNPPYNKGLDAVFRVGRIYEASGVGISRVLDIDEENWYELSDCRLATPQEIESHLKKICDEKYIGKKVKCLWTGEVGRIQEFKLYSDTFGEYCLYFDEEGNCIRVYDQGRFAEVVPDKKKLPKTKDELKQFMLDYLRAPILERYDTLTEYLSKYED